MDRSTTIDEAEKRLLQSIYATLNKISDVVSEPDLVNPLLKELSDLKCSLNKRIETLCEFRELVKQI